MNPASTSPSAEAIAWHTEDHLTDKSATTYDPAVADRWRAKGWPVTPMFSAPAAAVGGDPVAWEFRYKSGGRWIDWIPCLKERFDSKLPVLHDSGRPLPTEYRELYAAPVGGFVVVPREPTMHMLQAGSAAADGLGSPLTRTECAWNAMIAAAPAAQPSPHTTEDDYQHFLSYSGLEHSPLLQYAYYHGADVGLDKPKDAAQSSAKDGARVEEPSYDDLIQAVTAPECKFPPTGWHCTRGEGHDGPCASVPNKDLRSCAICGLSVDLSKGYVAPSSDFTMQGRTKPKATTGAGLVDGLPVHPHVRGRTLLTLLWQKYDSGGISMGRSFESVCLEAAMDLFDDFRDSEDVARCEGCSNVMDETRTYLSTRRRRREGLAEAAIGREVGK